MANRSPVASERLAFEGPNAAYHAYHASQLIVRYAAARHLVAGKSVLDAACGEGFGSYLLNSWGAAHVLGIDIAEEAIARARRYFGSEHCEFLRGDVGELGRSVGRRNFDVIVSFDTIEHIEDPEAFLRQLKPYLRDGTVLLISYANIPTLARLGKATDFHRAAYSFEAFRAMAEGELGRASQWLWTTPLLGEACIPHGDPAIRRVGGGAFPIVETTPISSAVLLPSQDNLAPTAETAAGYIGVWHAEIGRSAAVSVQSVAGHLRPWQEINWCKEENAQLRAAVGECETAKTEYFVPQLELRAAEIERLTAEIEGLRTAADQDERTRTEWLLPQLETRAAEINRLTEEIERLRIVIATGEASFQAERRRVLFYGEDSSDARRRIAELESELALVYHDLALVCRDLQNIKYSHSYALMQLYIRLHDNRGLGWPVRLAKRLARRLRVKRFAA